VVLEPYFESEEFKTLNLNKIFSVSIKIFFVDIKYVQIVKMSPKLWLYLPLRSYEHHEKSFFFKSIFSFIGKKWI